MMTAMIQIFGNITIIALRFPNNMNREIWIWQFSLTGIINAHMGVTIASQACPTKTISGSQSLLKV